MYRYRVKRKCKTKWHYVFRYCLYHYNDPVSITEFMPFFFFKSIQFDFFLKMFAIKSNKRIKNFNGTIINGDGNHRTIEQANIDKHSFYISILSLDIVELYFILEFLLEHLKWRRSWDESVSSSVEEKFIIHKMNIFFFLLFSINFCKNTW